MINLINSNIAKIILFFSISPGSKYQRKEIKENLKMNNIVLDNSLKTLLNQNILIKKERLYSLNLEEKFIRELLNEIKEKFANIPLNVQAILIEIIHEIQQLTKINQIILFGSYTKLIYHKDSDIDIAIIFDKKKDVKIKKMISFVINKVSKKYKKEIQEHFFTKEDLKNKKDPLIKEIIVNGRYIL